MKPNEQPENVKQADLFRTQLKHILDSKHPLYVLAGRINWPVFEAEFGATYHPGFGRPGVPIRVMVGLHYLKHMYDESDESVVAKFLENPYWQYFCGFQTFQHELPIHPTSMTRWRKRVGEAGVERMLSETVKTAQRDGMLKSSDLARVNVDTTVQEKAIAYPTDARLYHKARRRLVVEAKRRGIELRQSYERLSKRALRKQSQYAHAQQFKRARRQTKRLKVMLGRVVRDILRKAPEADERLQTLLGLAQRLLQQQRSDKNKLYALHAPEVECISKGKVHKKYEFGCKTSVVSTSKKCWVIGVKALHGNPYDGHTLKDAIDQSQRLCGQLPTHICVDDGYRGSTQDVPGAEVHLTRARTNNPVIRKMKRRRSAIEPVIGHMKADCGMGRNHLLGKLGDKFNAILSGCGFNLKKSMRGYQKMVTEGRLRFLLAWILLRWLRSNRPLQLPQAA